MDFGNISIINQNILQKQQTMENDTILDVDHFDINSDENQKRSSWCIESDSDEQQLRQELIQRATTRLRLRMLEQGLQDVMHQVVSLQTELETLRIDATITIDTVANIFNEPKTAEGTQRMNSRMDVLEKRLESHKSGLAQLNQSTPVSSEAMEKTESNMTAQSMSRLSSLSLVSSLFGRSNASSRATSISEPASQHSLKDVYDSLQEDDDISHIESLEHHTSLSSVAAEEDHPFYDLAGKRSFGAGSFCGSVYLDNREEPISAPTPCTNSADIRWRRRQRRQKHKKQLEQLQQQSDDDSVISEDVSTFSSLSCLSVTKNNDIFLQHPLSPITPPPHFTGSFFDQLQQPALFEKENPMEAWLSSHDDLNLNEVTFDPNLFTQRNVLDEAMEFLDSVGADGDDGGFGEDVYLLLKNPDLCRRPLSEIETEMNQLRQEKQPKEFMLKSIVWMFKPSTWYQLAIKYSKGMIYNFTVSTLQWCRFLSVLAAAVVISVLKGPEDIDRHAVYTN